MSDESLAWDYIEGLESPEQFEAFAHYRDLGPARRTLARVARDLCQPYGAVTRWARQCLWDERAQSYDKHRIAERARMRAAAEQEADQDWATQRAELLKDLHANVATAMGQLANKLATRRGEMRPNEITQALRVLLHFGNLAAGDATERVDLGEEIDYSSLTAEEIAALDKALPRKGQKE